MKKFLLFAATCSILSCTTQKMKYPETPQIAHEDQYFGEKLNDPYRWLEDDRSKETENWVGKQISFTQSYLEKIPFRSTIEKRLTELWNYEKISAPFKEGIYTYYYKNNGLQPQAVLYRKDSKGEEELFLDPNTFSKDGTTSLAGLAFNKKGTLAAYSISEAGSDWNKIIFINAVTKQKVGETLENVKFSGISWLGDRGIFYSSYDKPEGSQLSAKTDMHKVYFHTLETPQKEDILIFGGEKVKRRYISADVTEDENYLIISAANATNGNELYIKDVKNNSDFIPIQIGFENNSSILDNKGDTFYLITDKNAPNMKVQKFDIKNPTQWVDVLPETENVLSAHTGGGFLFAQYLKDAVTDIVQYTYEGQKIRSISLPGKGTATGFSGKKEDTTLYYSFTNYITPPSIFSLDVNSGKSMIYQKPKVSFDPDNYVSEQVFYTSKDGTRIPMMISYKKGTNKNAKNPTILYSYGGFNINLTPAFSVINALWMEMGGIYAVPNIRGGGEYGRKWHEAGTKMQKKNVFEDFIAAGEYLQQNGYTDKDHMAISGRSNGGLLVGATMTIRPDLAKVAFPGVGVLDMLRYHTFTAGAGWAFDYGTSADSKEMFEYLKSYSPVHNVVAGQCYPATMVITSDHDDRVVPAHSFKFGAELQKKQGCAAPVLIRIEKNAGHGAGRATSQIIKENADILSFALYEMGVSPK